MYILILFITQIKYHRYTSGYFSKNAITLLWLPMKDRDAYCVFIDTYFSIMHAMFMNIVPIGISCMIS